MFAILLISMSGIVVVHRILSLFEKIEVISSSKINFVFVLLQIPFVIQLIFKELYIWNTTYIGILLIILILSHKIIVFFENKTFEKLHLSIISRLILYLNAGQSSKNALESIWNELSSFEKQSFSALKDIFSQKKVQLAEKNHRKQFFFDELAQILISDARILNQLSLFRQILLLEFNLRHKSRQSLHQARAQALVCVPLYFFILTISVIYFDHKLLSMLSLGSFCLFCIGIYIIFNIGSKKRWQT